MSLRTRSNTLRRTGGWRVAMLALGGLLVLLSPIVGIVPGPGGIFVFAIGVALLLRHSPAAKRHYVRLKRRWPRWGALVDRGMRRRSARRRHALQSGGRTRDD